MYHQSVKNWREVERSATNLQSYWRDIKGVASNNYERQDSHSIFYQDSK